MDFTGETSEELPTKFTGVRKRCQDCPYKKDWKTHKYHLSKFIYPLIDPYQKRLENKNLPIFLIIN